MCGIVGLFTPRPVDFDKPSALTAMQARLQHRGPDSHGFWQSPCQRVDFAHRRLAIQDLSAEGHQPMRSASGRYSICFNGEIYNFLALREELVGLGVGFRGHSDTEVILAGLEAWGWDQLMQRLVGMFAFAVWDQADQTLTLGRDRFGEKPLYYGIIHRYLVFSSELKALFELPDWSGELNRNALAQYFRLGYINAPHSVFNGVFKLIPGALLQIDAQQVIGHAADPSGLSALVRPYWSVSDAFAKAQQQPLTDQQEALALLDKQLHQSVRRQMIADVPTGAFLSGGIDSSLVSALMQAESPRPIKTFTIGFHEKDYNEAGFAKKIAEHLGTDHQELYISAKDVLNLVPKIPQVYDEPFADSSQLPSILVAEMARRQVTVCLSGDAGDELFAGYNRYFWTQQLLAKSQRLPEFAKQGLARGILALAPERYDQAYRLAQSLLGRRQQQAAVGLKLHKLANILACQGAAEAYNYLISYWQSPASLVLGAEEPESVLATCQPGLEGDFIQQAMLWDLGSYLPGDNLTKVDRAAMSVSLETRLPLLDHQLAELSWRLPTDMKYRDGISKWALRQTLYKYVPEALIERPKMGFSVPIAQWLRGPLRDWAESLLSRERLEHQGLLDVQQVQQTWQQHLSGQRDLAQPLWTLLVFQDWLDHYRQQLTY